MASTTASGFCANVAVLGDITNTSHALNTFTKTVQPQPGDLPPPTDKSAEMVPLFSGEPPARQRPEDPFSAAFEGDAQDPQSASEYAADIFESLFDTESFFLPKADYMEHQSDINAKMRAILIDWLVDVHHKSKMCPKTLFLTVNIVDRYLSARQVGRKKLQLVGVVSMFIAAKFEEIDAPRAYDFAYITDNTYSKQEILRMECSVLAALDYQVVVPTPAHFLGRLQRVNGCDGVHSSFAQYLLELSLLDVRSLRHPPTVLVSAALLLSNKFLGKGEMWPAAMVHHSRRSESSVEDCASDLLEVLGVAKDASLHAVRKKYKFPRSTLAKLRVV